MAASTTLTVTGIIFIGLGAIIWMCFPGFLHGQIEKAKQLRKGNEIRGFWSKVPIPLDFKIYIFNVTNPEEAVMGKQPIVQEVGPYFYNEWKEKVDLVDDAEEDTITYRLKDTFVFDKEMSKPLTGNEPLVVPHLGIIGLVGAVSVANPAGLAMVSKAFNQLFNKPKSMFVTSTANQMLWEGFDLNCTKAKDFGANTVCGMIREDTSSVHVINDELFRMSYLGLKNATVDKHNITVKRGMKDVQEVGVVVKVDGLTEMKQFAAPCSQFRGTDTTIFAPFVHKQDLWSHGMEVCRSLYARYQEDKAYNGIPGYYYVADLGDESTIPEQQCYCVNSTCMKKGAFSLEKCVGVPFILTLPHFLHCDTEYQTGVKGVYPDIEKHGIYSIIEPMTATPMVGKRRMQFNIFLKQQKKVELMKNLSETPILLPLFWLEEGVELNETMTKPLKNMLYRPIKVVGILKYVIIGFGAGMIGLAILVHYKRTKISSDTSQNNNHGITQVGPSY